MGEYAVGSRESKLALLQTHIVCDMLTRSNPALQFPVVTKKTHGDIVQSKALYAFGGKALWTDELELMVREGLCRLIVHSLKDMPTSIPADMCVAAIVDRADPWDVLVMRAGSEYKTIADLPAGSVVGTSSMRRTAQLRQLYPRLRYTSIRGNIHTRLQKLDAPDSEYACAILAAAGLQRLGLGHRVTQTFDGADDYYAVGQGALGVECAAADTEAIELLQRLEKPEAVLPCLAERALMRRLEGGCSVPLGVRSSVAGSALPLEVRLRAIVISLDGTRHVLAQQTRSCTSRSDAEQLGNDVAAALLATGAQAILDEIRRVKEIAANE